MISITSVGNEAACSA